MQPSKPKRLPTSGLNNLLWLLNFTKWYVRYTLHFVTWQLHKSSKGKKSPMNSKSLNPIWELSFSE